MHRKYQSGEIYNLRILKKQVVEIILPNVKVSINGRGFYELKIPWENTQYRAEEIKYIIKRKITYQQYNGF